jgi:AbrB family looped-hinge helix DNA binding protein
MKTVTVSPKYQVVIPKEIRGPLHIMPGEKMQVMQYENRLELIPVKNIKDLRGFVKGINTTVKRDKDRI